MGNYSKSKKCREKGCEGIINISSPVTIKTGNTGSCAYACRGCGRLYFYNGRSVKGVIKTNGKKAFMPVFNF